MYFGGRRAVEHLSNLLNYCIIFIHFGNITVRESNGHRLFSGCNQPFSSLFFWWEMEWSNCV